MDPLTNDERIAALLDGRLSERERAELLAELGASDDELEILVDSVGLTRELEEEDRDEGVIPVTVPRPTEAVPAPITRPPVWRRPAVLGLAAAAVLVIGIAPFARKNFARPQPSYFSEGVPALSDPDVGIPAGWSHSWALTRGTGTQLSRRSTAVRLGVLMTDIELAVRAHDRERATAYADSAAGLLRQNDHRLAAQAYDQFAAREDLPPADSLAVILGETPGSLDKDLVDLGAWAEAARFAVRTKDAPFFDHPASKPYMEGRAPRLKAPAAAALEQVRAARPKAGATEADWQRLDEALRKLLEEAG